MNREELKDEKRNKLLDASYYLFLKKGIRNTSIQDIVDEAGLGKGTFYFYFKDKYQVKNILINQKANNLLLNAFHKLELQKNLLTLADKAIFTINELIDELKNNPDLLKFVSKDLSYNIYRNAIDELYQNNEKTILDLFSNGLKENGDKIKHPEILLNMILELVCSTCYNSILYSQPLPIDDFKPFLYDNIRVLIENPNN